MAMAAVRAPLSRLHRGAVRRHGWTAAAPWHRESAPARSSTGPQRASPSMPPGGTPSCRLPRSSDCRQTSAVSLRAPEWAAQAGYVPAAGWDGCVAVVVLHLGIPCWTGPAKEVCFGLSNVTCDLVAMACVASYAPCRLCSPHGLTRRSSARSNASSESFATRACKLLAVLEILPQTDITKFGCYQQLQKTIVLLAEVSGCRCEHLAARPVSFTASIAAVLI